MADLKKEKTIVTENLIKPSAVKKLEQMAVLKKVQDGLDQSIKTTEELMVLAKRTQAELAVIPQRATAGQKNKLASPDVQQKTLQEMQAKLNGALKEVFAMNELLKDNKQTLTQVKGQVSDISSEEAPKSHRFGSK